MSEVELSGIVDENAATSTTCKANMSTAGTNGCTCGKSGLSAVCFTNSPVAWRWQSVDWSASMPSQFAIALTDAWLVIIIGQAYAPTASCINSMLNSAIHATLTRSDLSVFMSNVDFTSFICFVWVYRITKEIDRR